MRKEGVKRIEFFKMWIWRRIDREDQLDRTQNERSIEKGGKRSLMEIIRSLLYKLGTLEANEYNHNTTDYLLDTLVLIIICVFLRVVAINQLSFKLYTSPFSDTLKDYHLSCFIVFRLSMSFESEEYSCLRE